jgi:hypothetical protein
MLPQNFNTNFEVALSVLIFGNLLCVVNKIGGGVNGSKDFFFKGKNGLESSH